jgi:PAS domain S-box-containing protein
VEDTTDIVYSMNTEGVILFISPQVRRYGFDEKDIVGRRCLELVHEEDRERMGRELERTLRTGEEITSLFRVPAPRGDTVWIEGSGRPQHDDSGEVMGLTGVMRDVTKRTENEHMIRLQRDELRIMAARMDEAQEYERRRIAAGLHDEVAQLLAGCRLKLSLARDAGEETGCGGPLDEVDRLLEKATEQVRGLCFELSSESLFDAGFTAAAAELCDHMSRRHGVRFQLNRPPEDPPLPKPLRPSLYHCLRELMYNVVKHAGTDSAAVKIGTGGDTFRVTVRDHGSGFEPADLEKPLTREGGFGLRQVRRRLRDTGGDLLVESVPGDGTRAVMEVPLGGWDYVA